MLKYCFNILIVLQWIGPLGWFNQRVAMSVYMRVTLWNTLFRRSLRLWVKFVFPIFACIDTIFNKEIDCFFLEKIGSNPLPPYAQMVFVHDLFWRYWQKGNISTSRALWPNFFFGIGATMRICQEIQCLPDAGFCFMF